MNKHFLLSPTLNLIEFLGDLLLEERETVSLVVFPGKRPAHFLRKYLSDKIKLFPLLPKIFSQDEFIDYLYETQSYNDNKIKDIDGVGILYKINKEENFFHRERMELDEFLPWGYKLFSDLEEMQQEMINIEKIKSIDEISGRKIPPTLRKKLLSLSNFHNLFYKHMEEHSLSTRSFRYRKVAESIDKINLDAMPNIYICGFFALTLSEREIFLYLSKKDRVKFIFQKGPYIEKTISQLKIDCQEVGGDSVSPELSLNVAADIHGEIFALNQIIGRKMDYGSEVIVLPLSECLFPLLQHTAAFAGNNYNVSLGYPLFQTPIYSLIRTLEKLFEGKEEEKFFLPDYLNFVLHPYIKNIYFNRASYPTRILFHMVEDIYLSEEKRFITLEEIEEDENILERCLKILQKFDKEITKEQIKNHLKNIHQGLIKPFEVIVNIDDFSDKIINFISFISQKSTANIHPFSSPFIAAVQEAVGEIKNSYLREEILPDKGSYFGFLRSFIRSIYYPFLGTPLKGLQVLGVLETRNLKFDTVYFLDLNEGIVPAVKKEDTILPFEVRKYLCLPTSEEREKISRYYFETLIYGAKEVHLFYLENKDKEKSRYVEKLIWDMQKKTKQIISPEKEIFFPCNFSQKNTLSIKKTEDMVLYLGENINFSPSGLDTYLHCQVRFYYSYLLGLLAQKDITEDTDRGKIGKIVHKILKEFFKQKIGKKLVIEKDDYEIMRKRVVEEFKNNHLNPDKGATYLIRAQIERRMKDILDFHREKYSEVIILECEGKMREIKVELLSGKKVTLKGKFDRIDKRGEDIYIIDYKSGANSNIPKKFILSEREKWPRTLKSVQLPFYIMIYLEERQGISENKINGELLLLGKKDIEKEVLFKGEERNLFADYKKAIFTLIEEILSLEVNFKPTLYPQDNCPRCDFKVICGRQWM